MSLYLGNTVISGVATPIDGSIAIGQIISSIIPLTDAGLHLLDGALIQGGGIYDDFVQYIADLANLYPQCFCNEADWQGTVNAYGACGKFVYDSANNTVRLPKITGFIEGTINSNALGNLVEAGLPNITGYIRSDTYGSGGTITSADGAFYTSENNNPQNVAATGSSGANYHYRAYIDASRSSAIYGKSSTVQPQSIKVYYYIVIATTVKTNIEVDIDNIVTDLNDKADNVDVVHLTGTETITGAKTFTGSLTIPSNTFIAKQNDDVEGGQIVFQKANNDPLYQNPVIDLYSGFIRFLYCSGVEIPRIDSPSGHLEFIKNRQSPNDNPSYPGYYLAFEDVSGWQKIMSSFNFQVVSTLPANPNGNVFYFIPE